MNRTVAAALAGTLGLLACDARDRAGGEGAAGPRVGLKGTPFRILTVARTEKDRRLAPSRLERVEGDQAHLLSWPRERFLKLETKDARASFDAAFLDRSGRVVDTALFAQGDREGLVPRAEAAHVLLVAPGLLGKLGVRPGDAAAFSPDLAAATPQELPVVTIGEHRVFVELALDAAEREQGLMFRPRLSADDGMLFVYPSEGPRTFWMGNTLIPLDIAFLRSDGTLVNVNETPTYPDPRHPPAAYATSDSAGPAQYVLETNLGWFRRRGITDADGRPRPGIRAVLPPEALRGFAD